MYYIIQRSIQKGIYQIQKILVHLQIKRYRFLLAVDTSADSIRAKIHIYYIILPYNSISSPLVHLQIERYGCLLAVDTSADSISGTKCKYSCSSQDTKLQKQLQIQLQATQIQIQIQNTHNQMAAYWGQQKQYAQITNERQIHEYLKQEKTAR